MLKIRNILLATTLLLLLHACATPPPISMGAKFPHASLASLKQGKSSLSDVKALLGPPRGFGKAKQNPQETLRDIWFYEYIEMHGTQVHLDILLIFLNKDIYEGHLWFASNELVERVEKHRDSIHENQ